jgi:two-component system NtrC family sensor kinase
MEQILVVDDHIDVARVLTESWLPAIGYQAQRSTGSDVHTILQHDTFDLVLLDFHRADASGIERLELIRRERPDLPVILMVAPGAEKRAVEAFQLGIRNYLLKPFSFDQLQHAVEEVLREQRLARENQRLTQRLRQRIHELIVLSAIGRSVTRAVDLDEVLKRIVEAALHLTRAEEGVLLLRDGDQLRIRAAHTQRDSGMWFANESFPHHAAEQILRTWQPVRVAQQSLFINPVQPVQNGLLVPLLANGEILGALGIANVVRAEPFADEHERLLAALADYAAIAIENARLFAAREQSEARYRDLFRNASDLLLVVDHRWQIVEANSVAPRLLLSTGRCCTTD